MVKCNLLAVDPVRWAKQYKGVQYIETREDGVHVFSCDGNGTGKTYWPDPDDSGSGTLKIEVRGRHE